GAVFDDESGVNHARADLLRRRSEKTFGRKLNECDGNAFGIFKLEMPDAAAVFSDCASANVVREEVAAHLFDVGRGEGNFGQEVCGSAGSDLEQLDLLAVVHGEAGKRRGDAPRGAMR